MNFIKLRSGSWAVRYHLPDGGRRQVDTRQKDYHDAKRFAAEAKIAEIETAARIIVVRSAAVMNAIVGKRIGSMEAFDEWKKNLEATRKPGTAHRYVKILRLFLRDLNWPVALASIKALDIDKWVNNVEAGTHLQTRNVHRSALRSYFEYCLNEGWLASNPVSNVSVKHHLLRHDQKESEHRRPFTPEEFERLIAVAKAEPMPYWFGMVSIARYAGLRFGDVDSMETSSILSDRLIVWTAKKDRRVELQMPPELPPVFDALAKHPLNQPIASSVPGRLFQQRPAEVWGVHSDDFKRLLAKANVDTTLVFHALRHTYATELAKSGLPVTEIAKRMGHFSRNTTMRYLQSLVFVP